MSVKIKDIVGLGPQHPRPEHVSEIVEQIRQSRELQENFFQNFEGLARELERQSRDIPGVERDDHIGTMAKEIASEASWQAENVRRFVAAVRKRLAP